MENQAEVMPTEVQETELQESSGEVVTNSKSVVIEANNPTPEDMAAICHALKEKHQGMYDVKDVRYPFKKSTDKDTQIETMREAVIVPVTYLSVAGLISVLEAAADDPESKTLALVMEALEAPVNSVVRELLSDDTGLNAGNFPLDKITWEAIANMPKAQRKGGGIPKETWEAFGADYVAVMPEATGRSIAQCTNAAKILIQRLAGRKTDRVVLKFIIEMLAIYATKTDKAEEFKDCIAFCHEKANGWLNVSEADLMANL